MGIDTPTPTGSSSAASNNSSQPSSSSGQFPTTASGGICNLGSASFDTIDNECKAEDSRESFELKKEILEGTVVQQQHRKEEYKREGDRQQHQQQKDDSFPEDLNGLDGLDPLANLVNATATGDNGMLDLKMEPYFNTFSTSSSSSINHPQQSHQQHLFSHQIQSQHQPPPIPPSHSHHQQFHHHVPGTPASANGLLHGPGAVGHPHSHQHSSSFLFNNGPGSAPAGGPCSADSGHSSSGATTDGGSQRRPSSSQTWLVIRDPFAPDLPPPTFQRIGQSPSNRIAGEPKPLNWDGKPPEDAKSMPEMARIITDPTRPPMVPLPNVKDGGMPPGGIFPQWSFFNTPMQRQRLEQIYPKGTFENQFCNRSSWSLMPMPPMIRPILPQINRIILMPVKPGLQIPPGFIPPYLVNRIPPNTIPAIILPGPNGLMTVPLGHIPPGMLPGTLIQPPTMPAAGIQPPQSVGPHITPNTSAPTPAVTGVTNNGGAGGNRNSGGKAATTGNGGNSGGMGGGQQQGKPKKETAKQRKQREKMEEQQRREREREQQEAAVVTQQQQQQQMAAALSIMGRSPMMEGGGPPPAGMAGQMPMTPQPIYGDGPPMSQQQQQQPPPLFQQHQEACFKVPGRSSPLKRSNSSRGNVVPLLLAPMPEQRIHDRGQCCTCQKEIDHRHKAIQCTAISQGCNQLFHWECAELTSEAFTEFCNDTRLEWICSSCFDARNKEHTLMFAC